MINQQLTPLLSVELPVELTNGNDGRGSKWFRSAKVREQMEKLLRSLGHVYSPIGFPVVIKVTRLLGKGQRLWDASSGFRGNWKELEDAMVVCGWFHDDSPKWIRNCYFDQLKQPGRVKPGVLVEIFTEHKTP